MSTTELHSPLFRFLSYPLLLCISLLLFPYPFLISLIVLAILRCPFQTFLGFALVLQAEKGLRLELRKGATIKMCCNKKKRLQ